MYIFKFNTVSRISFQVNTFGSTTFTIIERWYFGVSMWSYSFSHLPIDAYSCHFQFVISNSLIVNIYGLCGHIQVTVFSIFKILLHCGWGGGAPLSLSLIWLCFLLSLSGTSTTFNWLLGTFLNPLDQSSTNHSRH